MAKNGHRGWGHIRRLPSGRFQASYLHGGQRHTAPTTYSVRLAAEGWLADERRLIESRTWSPPAHREAKAAAAELTLRDFATRWLKQRNIAPRTRETTNTIWSRASCPRWGIRC